MKIENKIILRRLIAGILLILISIYCLYESYQVATWGQKFNISKMINAGGGGYLIAIFGFIIGLIFTFTARTRPVKWLEYSIAAIEVIIFVIVGNISIGQYFSDLHIFQWGFFILVMLGLPFKQGFKDMPFVSKSDAKKETAPIKQQVKKTIKEPVKNEDLSQLVELKKLLDSGVIAQADFDAKKKQLLGL
ncbi:MAG: SHOCT domain-containing protein [Oenococcus oeni]